MVANKCGGRTNHGRTNYRLFVYMHVLPVLLGKFSFATSFNCSLTRFCGKCFQDEAFGLIADLTEEAVVERVRRKEGGLFREPWYCASSSTDHPSSSFYDASW